MLIHAILVLPVQTVEAKAMKRNKLVSVPSLPILLTILSLAAPAQWDKKPYTAWSEKDAQKVLNDSPWGKTQVFSTPGEMFRSPTSGRQGTATPTEPNPAQALHLNFRMRFLSARPIRQAYGRLLELRQKGGMNEQAAAQLKQFVSGEFLEYVIVAVTCDSQEAGANTQQAMSLLNSRGTADLKNNTFLEIKGGQRVFLQEFQPPHQDGIGARFIFPRLINGKPFITSESEEIHFVSELSSTYKLDRRYKIKEMVLDGKLEY
jgi:hypothetical protein